MRLTYSEAKFIRDEKDAPSEWIIFPLGFNKYELVHIGPPRDYMAPIATVGKETSVPYLRVVK